MKRTLCTTSPEFNSSYYIVSTTEIRGSTDNTFTWWIRCETTTIIISLGCAIYTDLGTWWASSHGKEHHPRWGLFFHSLGLHFGGLPTSPSHSLASSVCLSLPTKHSIRLLRLLGIKYWGSSAGECMFCYAMLLHFATSIGGAAVEGGHGRKTAIQSNHTYL